MNNALYEQLDEVVGQILSGELVDSDEFDPIVQELLPFAKSLRILPRPEFRSALLADLVEPKVGEVIPIRSSVLPPLFVASAETYPVHRSNFAVSAALHAAALVLIATSSLWLANHPITRKVTPAVITNVSPFLPEAPTRTGGGGGGGDRDKIAASKGDAPRFAAQQITPPAIVVRNNDPKLAVDPTVIGPPSITLSKLGNTGDPLTGILGSASNGTGIGGGIGSGAGGGVGSGRGPGVGPGYGGGIGGGIYVVGGGVRAPRAIYDPDPKYTDEARKAHVQGVVLLWVVIGPDGRTHDVRVQRSLGMGLDEKAIEAVRNWKFEPATKDGQPVAVQVNVEVDFRLY
jgi:protein TonB